MSKYAVAGLIAAVLVGTVPAQEAPKAPTPTKEHQWLKQLEGEWTMEGEASMGPDQPKIKMKAVETIRNIGDFWSLGEMKGECMGVKMTGITTIGYDSTAKKFVGSWVCSMCDQISKYEGELDSTGKVLTLNCEGPSPLTGKTVKMKDVVELKDKDTKTLTSSMLGDDGKWTVFMTATSKRVNK